MPSNYTEASIKTLSSTEHIRLRPGMYIGRLGNGAHAEDVVRIETELVRANDIESDDTSCVRVTTVQGRPVTVAVTLCAEHPGEPYVLVHGTEGRITYWYKQDRVLLQRAGHGPEEFEYGRTDLLENLVAHLTDV